MAQQKKKQYQYRSPTENTPARELKFLCLFIGTTPIEEVNKVYKIGTDIDNHKEKLPAKYCRCKEPDVIGVAIARFCRTCRKDIHRL